jgi:DNA modification methylase
MSKIFYLTEAASKIGVAPITLKRWFLEGKIADVKRDRKGWRIFTSDDLERIKKFAERTTDTFPQQLSFRGEGFQDSSVKSSSFRDSAFNGNKKLPFHRWVPWIAGFSASFVEDCFTKYIKKAAAKKKVILDPFAGVGTTLIEGILHGYDCIGFEINPYAYLACKVKLNAHQYNTSKLKEELDKLMNYFNKRANNEDYVPKAEPPKGFRTKTPFFSPRVLRKVLIIIDFINNISDREIRDLFRLAFGTVMVSFSNYSYEPSLGRKSSAGRPDVIDADVDKIIGEKVKSMIEDIEEFEELHAKSTKSVRAQIYNESFFRAQDFLGDKSIDLLVTSPPYLNNYHYLRNTRPQLSWLDLKSDRGIDVDLEEISFGKFWQTVRDQKNIVSSFSLRSLEEIIIRLRNTNIDKGPYGGPGWANYATTYFNDSYRFCKIIKDVLKSNCAAVVVIGNSIIQGIEIRTDEIFSEIAKLAGLKTKDIILLRKKRTGSSIVNSTVRAEVIQKKTELYETAVVLET